ncbi:hypothetical protein A6V39_03335 [Candidatus Mycoplasma haematobovis]|uniref:Uncharacterized protein n=1 Tax=Candidatus Mycoplasma haematobovis TaxID=432608 RepID=A0A1A9QCF6_9MOLU|nr:hypothetical protein [Candidatus Mycoplasma haematobovis]OAL09918.1 hypothetical protein A6V39_03335 [Candidatus Mycoplasma haematobovis]
MNILPHHIAATFLLGGLIVGGYFTFNALTPPSLDNHLRNLGIEILSSGWDAKEAEYKKTEAPDLIPSISKTEVQNKIPDFASNLEKWCKKYKEKYFLGIDDANYKRFSLWCTSTIRVDAILGKRVGLIALVDNEVETVFNTYNDATNTDKFLGSPSKPKTALTSADLTSWCTKKKAENYKYESDPDFKRVIKWCYKKA